MGRSCAKVWNKPRGNSTSSSKNNLDYKIRTSGLSVLPLPLRRLTAAASLAATTVRMLLCRLSCLRGSCPRPQRLSCCFLLLLHSCLLVPRGCAAAICTAAVAAACTAAAGNGKWIVFQVGLELQHGWKSGSSRDETSEVVRSANKRSTQPTAAVVCPYTPSFRLSSMLVSHTVQPTNLVIPLLHVQRRVACHHPDLLGWRAGHQRVRRHWLEHKGACSHLQAPSGGSSKHGARSMAYRIQ